jgi:hypothetical protein
VSLAIATGRGWGLIQPYVESLEVAAAAVQGEVVVVDSSGQPPPPDGSLAPSTRWLTQPRGSVYSVRALMLDACRGDIICLTEDHCRVEPDWAVRLRDLHHQYPEALAIGGPVDNSAVDKAIDWASFFVVQPELVPPVKAEPRGRLGHANVSYKRAALEGAEEISGLGMLESLTQRSLSAPPGAMRMDPSPLVWHDQARPAGYVLRQNFHAGRTYGGFVRAAGGRRRWVRLLGAPALPVVRLVRASAIVRRSSHADRLPAALPWMLIVLLFQVTGQVTGLLFGAGNSPLSVEG